MVSRFRQSKEREQIEDANSDRVDGLFIPVHWLHTHAYCEYQIYLEKVKGLVAPPTFEMLAGAEKHAILDTEHIRKAEIELTVNEAAIKAQMEAVSLVSRDISVKGITLYGRIDEVVFEPGRIVIIDDKPGAQPYFSNRVQVWGYCQAFRETYHPDLPLFGALRQEDTDNIIWLEEYSREQADLIHITVKRIQSILSSVAPPRPTDNIRRCKPCRFKVSCPACAGR
jgi:CRISPR-associated exonuclease Cas4